MPGLCAEGGGRVGRESRDPLRQAHQERLGGFGVGCPEEAGWKPAGTHEGAGTSEGGLQP